MEHLEHQSESEISAHEAFLRERDAVREITGGLTIESTSDTPDQIAAALFAPTEVRGPVVTVATRSVQTSRGGLEHPDDEVALEDHRTAVPGQELTDDQRAFKARADEYALSYPDFGQVLNQGGEIPLACQRTILKLQNGPQVAHFLATTGTEVRAALCNLAAEGKVLQAVARTRQIGADLERMNWNLEGDYTQYRDSRNAADRLRRRQR